MTRATSSVICLLLLSACSLANNAPETTATRFIRVLVAEPRNVDSLRNFTDVPAGQDPTNVLHGLSTDVAVNYLQTRERQGEKQDFTANAVRPDGPAVRIVTVRVYRAGGKGRNAVSFRVALRSVPGRGWLVTAVSAE